MAQLQQGAGALSGRLDGITTQQLGQAQAVNDRLASQERVLADALAKQAAAAAERFQSQERTVAGKLGEVAQIVGEALAKQAAASAERLQAQERTLAEAVAALHQRVNATLVQSAEKTHESLTGLAQKLALIDAAQKNITALSEQVGGLAAILDNKQQRGAFGETRLEDLVRDALPPDAYVFQATLSTGVRADCLLKLPDPPGPIAVDSKFPLEGWRALRAATAEPARIAAARQFDADVRKHLRDISEKYIIPGETADGALMFVPSEAIYAALHAEHASVVEDARKRRVYIVSPSTLWALLNTIRAVMRDVEMRKEMAGVQKLIALMLRDVQLLDQRVGNLRRHFTQTEKDIGEIETSTRNITSRGERIAAVRLDEPDPNAALPPPPG
ncbi:MAG: DNA recombination protein RmuC [Alphaproteobacteria bacterium]|nr:DNA recombination protein RmuC [Alphaproteobacteria bacterium]